VNQLVLFFQIVEGVENLFHSNLDLYLPPYLNSVAILDECVKEDPVFLAVELCFLVMERHTTSMFSTQTWQLLLVSVILTSFTKFTCLHFSHFHLQNEKATKQPSLLGVLVLLHQWLIFRDGSLIEDATAIALALLPKEDVNEEEQMAS
jgi:hypothetical protein